MLNWINKQSEGAKILLFVAVYGIIIIPAIILTVSISLEVATRIGDWINHTTCDAVCCILRG